MCCRLLVGEVTVVVVRLGVRTIVLKVLMLRLLRLLLLVEEEEEEEEG